MKDHTYYFIDMEYCVRTLEDFIKDIRTTPGGKTSGPLAGQMDLDKEQRIPAIMPMRASPDILNTLDVPAPPTFPEDEQIGWQALINVLKDITSGLIYIHSQRFVHRDLKPSNGITLALHF